MTAIGSRWAATCLLTIAGLTWGCGSSSSSGHPAAGGSSGSGGAPVTSMVCGRGPCATDLSRARAALETGKYTEAFALYECADSAEAAFGAGLMRSFLILENQNVSALLADFGQPPLPATDIFGASGILSREAARWNGQGALTLSGGTALELAFDRAQQRIPDDTALDGYGTFKAEDWTSPTQADLSISLGSPSPSTAELTSGATLAVSFNCTAPYPTRNIDPRLSYVDLSFEQAGVQNWCSLPYFSSAGECQTDGGRILVSSAATGPGQQASYTFDNLLLSCEREQDGDAEPVEYLVRVNGAISAVAVSQKLDTTGLHPMFADQFVINGIPSDRTGTDLVQHAGAAGAELEEAACFFARAGQGSGTVFTLPGALFGGSDLPVSKGDSQILAGFALLAAAAAQLGLAYDIDMPLHQLICDSDADANTCLSDQAYVDGFNQAFASAFHAERFAIAERLLGEALPLLEAGISNLDTTSLLVKNSVSSQGLGMLLDIVRAAEQSLHAGKRALPHLTPALMLDLRAFFANPKNPQSMNMPPLIFEQQCDVDGCTSSTNVAPAFLDEYFAGAIEADWEGTYNWTDDGAISDAAQEAARNVGRQFIVGN